MRSRLPMLRVLRQVRRHLDGDVSLATVSRLAGWSPFHLHRRFREIVGETPKQYTLRLRLEAAAARLLTTEATILRIAIEAGFDSPEVFTRAFVRRFTRTPS